MTDCDTRDLVLGVKVDIEAMGDHLGKEAASAEKGTKGRYTLTLRDWRYET